MMKYWLFHTLIVLMFMCALVYGLLERNTQGIIIVAAAAVIGTVLVISNHNKFKVKN